MKKLSFLIFIYFLLMSSGTMTYAADKGEELYNANRCVTCHGSKGVKTPAPVYPQLAGQDKSYLLQVMKEMKDGSRTQGMTAVMLPSLQGLSEDDLEAISEWLSHL